MTPDFISDCGRVRLFCADCRNVLPVLTGIDALISDPPYGMNWNTDGTRFSGGMRERGGGWSRGKNWVVGIEGDDTPFDPSPWIVFDKCVLFGSNHFGARLPVGTTLIWIKRDPSAFGTFLSDAEIAWMKGGHGVYCKMGPHPESMAAERLHPTQKPVALMAWCMEMAGVPVGATVLDPFCGSASVGIACLRTGRKFVGIEISSVFFDTARTRLRRELAQGQLFPPAELAPPEQLDLPQP